MARLGLHPPPVAPPWARPRPDRAEPRPASGAGCGNGGARRRFGEREPGPVSLRIVRFPDGLLGQRLATAARAGSRPAVGGGAVTSALGRSHALVELGWGGELAAAF